MGHGNGKRHWEDWVMIIWVFLVLLIRIVGISDHDPLVPVILLFCYLIYLKVK